MDNGYDSSSIIRIIKEIKNDKTTTNAQRYYQQKYPEFVKKFPKLFFAAFDEAFDERMLNLMLNKRETIIEQRSLGTFDQMTQEIHETLNEKYVYPVFPKEQLTPKT